MRTAALAVALFCAAACAQDRGAAQISGFVVDASGNPIVRAAVTLVTAGADPLDAFEFTDSRGAFAFTGLPARKYLLFARKETHQQNYYGSVAPDSPPEVLILEAGEVRRGLVVRLHALGSLSGVVLDPDGDPIEGAQVELLVAGYARGKRKHFNRGVSNTDTKGEYRFFRLPAGSYVVACRGEFQRVRQIQPEGVPEQPAAMPKYGAQFYPLADRLSAAVPVEVPAGKGITGIDFRLSLQRPVRVKGSVVVPPECGGEVSINVQPQDGPEGAMSYGAAARAPEYTFEFGEVLPGDYRLVAGSQSEGRACRGVTMVEIGQNADQPVSVTLQPGVPLSGTVSVEGKGPGPNPTRVHLVPGDGLPMNASNPQAAVNADGTFHIENVLPGIWDIGVQPIPPGGFIKSMRLGDQDVLTEDMVIDPSTSAPLNIVVSARGGVVEVTVAPAKAPSQAAPAHVRAAVMLAPDGRFAHVLSFYQMKLADAAGHVEFRGVTPGTYRLYAFDRVPGIGRQDPQRLVAPYRDQGAPLEIAEGERVAKTIRLIATAERGK